MGDFIDELRLLRNNYHLGSYPQVIDEALSSRDASVDRRVLAYRALLASNKLDRVISELQSSPDAELQAVRLHALHQQAIGTRNSGAKAKVVGDILALVGTGNNAHSSTVQAITALILYAEERYTEALQGVLPIPRNLECVAIAVQCYLKLDRPEFAQREVEKLRTWADDATLAQLAEAWAKCAVGGRQNIQDSEYIFEELASSKSATGRIISGRAICKMQAGEFAEAERILVEGLSRCPNDPDLIANLVSCAAATGKSPEIINQYFGKLKELAPQHPLVEEYTLKESLFQRSAQRFALAK
ncbi:coatomer epsilon subunit-domain-containing protein [Fimicolochytrium jonesii]|uniref:coatomer epsilon subunit-domain-containing protein n=1 Tax=Fimicolochytrium jonesii TaxID=1396493 RepID=UPI0022FE0468|nr:coatomer epsilon subunit-domain-containing protein [Fimicolochytrium jonesii]KAI8824476.1 coatomer epsilon subunit-domain-containing protein [Fimicolochytrium jonesii]